MLQQRWVKIVPHVVDTLLLVSALTLVFGSDQYPFEQPWLTAKVLALIVYIALGTIELKGGQNQVHTKLGMGRRTRDICLHRRRGGDQTSAGVYLKWLPRATG